MVNRYPLWLNLLVLGIMLLGLVYASANLFPEDYAVQVSDPDAEAVDPALVERVRDVLIAAKVEPKRVSVEEGRLLARFDNPETQLEAMDRLRDALERRYVVALNLAPATPQWLKAIGGSPISYGLDLRGGVHFQLRTDMDEVQRMTLNRYEGEFRTLMRNQDLRYLGISRVGDTLLAKFRDVATRDAALEVLRDEYRRTLSFNTDKSEQTYLLRAQLTEQAAEEMRNSALMQNITTLRRRVNELGVAEPVVQRQGADRIVVELPGVQDTARAKEILGATATLEFRLVDEDHDPYQAAERGRPPAGTRLYYERDGSPILLERRVMLTGDYIVDAASGIDQQSGGPMVHITLDGKGARLFSRVSGRNVGRLMAVVFIENKTETVMRDGEKVQVSRKTEEVINVARIREQLGKRFQITGLDSTREAHDLALLLRAGSLAAPMTIVEERTVGPSLGEKNIERGFLSIVVGMALVLIFMPLYYRGFGLIADAALLANVILIVAMMSIFPFVLTLPGIAGIVLTVGMAVDANVLIFERIREEIGNGNSPQASIDAGYSKALSTIADANITTLIAALVLFGFGTGPIKGFAVTLTLGVISSMFTAIVGSRAVVNLIHGGRRLKSLSI